MDKLQNTINNLKNDYVASNEHLFPVWLTISEAAKLGAINSKTIRRAISDKKIKYKIVKQKYLVDFISIVQFIRQRTKLQRKMNERGIGQYIGDWKI